MIKFTKSNKTTNTNALTQKHSLFPREKNYSMAEQTKEPI